MPTNVLRHGVVPQNTESLSVHEATYVGQGSPQFNPTQIPHIVTESQIGTTQYIGFVAELNTSLQMDHTNYVNQPWAITQCLIPCVHTCFPSMWSLTKNADRVVDRWNDMLFLPAKVLVTVHHVTRERTMYLTTADKEPTPYTHHFVWLEFQNFDDSKGVIMSSKSARHIPSTAELSYESKSPTQVEIVSAGELSDNWGKKNMKIVNIKNTSSGKKKKRKGAKARGTATSGAESEYDTGNGLYTDGEREVNPLSGFAPKPGDLDSWMNKIEKARADTEDSSSSLQSRLQNDTRRVKVASDPTSSPKAPPVEGGEPVVKVRKQKSLAHFAPTDASSLLPPGEAEKKRHSFALNKGIKKSLRHKSMPGKNNRLSMSSEMLNFMKPSKGDKSGGEMSDCGGMDERSAL
ncbi:hypothetical protein SARC_07964 [Sphaeroforma arctica JP610]|uniref:Uncharacterized protein n=1 Tax=Sphaeroforma arctica JP610 TaxID=667725 RepID=A0A0L0FSG6_9EUKA|nr:hypothetical protein SARC_07964 [Sphaeroforma arctica JP610]KNC79644.1 hypothetical protein SARC_07964 [Sphaeroforma arctica JP610]|eukprot:XP_014153546.1 hypothetical protein SARC_07964 [Sphaeroforma arctica JP610]